MLYGKGQGKVDMERQKDHLIIDHEVVAGSKRIYQIGRRIQDIIFSGLALIVLFPWMLLIALAIYIDDPHGSPLYMQMRCGLDGRLFKLYKFRSMYVDAEKFLESLMERNEADGPVFKMHNDPRVTRVGRFLRSRCLDELPQLWNVLKGDMSIVGPRPALPEEVAQYHDYERQRLCIRPGLTCFWQIEPERHGIRFSDWVELDIRYIKERSFRTDWKIILKTIRVIFTSDWI